MTDGSFWHSWHSDYDDADSDLAHRLIAVQARLRAAVDAIPAGPIRVISACAGEGRDVAGALAGHARLSDISGRLVELDAHLAARASRYVRDARLSAIEVLQADAGITDAYDGAVPADVLLLCGIFGNVSPGDVYNTVRRASMLCSPSATVIWTRHRRAPDQSPDIRRWFGQSGFTEIAFDSPGPDQYAVCTERLIGKPLPFETGVHLFTFADDRWGREVGR